MLGNDVRVSIEDVADRLYALEPEEFTAARDDAAKNTDGDERKQIKALRKPTVGAYVVNVQRPEQSLYRIALQRKEAVAVEDLVTVVYRPEASHAP